jgi:restriction system protein
VAKRHGLWAEIQRERARQERVRQRESREFQRAEALAAREAAKAERDRKRKAAAGERERKKLYVEDRKAEAAAMAEDVRARLAELDGLLTAGLRERPVVTFASLRRTDTYPAFDAGPLGEPLPPPAWEDFAPASPSGLGKILGGTGRFERQLDSARRAYDQAAEQHAAAEADRCRQLAAQRAAYDAAAAAFGAEVAEHNAAIDQLRQDCRAEPSLIWGRAGSPGWLWSAGAPRSEPTVKGVRPMMTAPAYPQSPITPRSTSIQARSTLANRNSPRRRRGPRSVTVSGGGGS